MKLELKSATLTKRYKRFLADITLPSGTETTIHCANTGAMTGCAQPNNQVWFSTSDNPKRKYPFSWEISITDKKHMICVNTIRANQLVEEAILSKKIIEVEEYDTLRREVKYGSENSKIDFLLANTNDINQTSNNCYIEVKSVTLLDETNQAGQGYFPDAVSIRGQKHLRELIEVVEQGGRAILLFAVLHTGISNVRAANHIDIKYAELLQEAYEKGVEIIAYKAEFFWKNDTCQITLNTKIPVCI